MHASSGLIRPNRRNLSALQPCLLPPQSACHAHAAAQPSRKFSEKFMYLPLRMIPRVAAAVVLSFASLSVLAQVPTDDAAPAKAADNTGVNVRDRSDATVTPFDQPNNAADIKVAAAVRHSITAEDSLSTMAHNIKLVASAGVVTLRGRSKTQRRRRKSNSWPQQRLVYRASATNWISNNNSWRFT